ncbi:hypothetical protein [Jiella avicenniae]|uniref:Uncharacterized protein n=1 Tax=Jiella avicenniae TaxID=2907202 RepID=A0A9X1T3S4_9HYPH|nr:hypothetical protein [Jiella avicenniae]MCE7026575.1 hypothetical protein [Jiella avicenniae]
MGFACPAAAAMRCFGFVGRCRDPSAASGQPARQAGDDDVAVDVVTRVAAAAKTRLAAEFAADALADRSVDERVEPADVVHAAGLCDGGPGRAVAPQRRLQFEPLAYDAVLFPPRLHLTANSGGHDFEERSEVVGCRHAGTPAEGAPASIAETGQGGDIFLQVST